jgi:small subunit ribosomal protein S4
MGDPKKSKKKYNTPSHPWQKARIEEESALEIEYGTKNKKELWKESSKLREFKAQAKKYAFITGTYAEKQKLLFLKKLTNLGIIKENGTLDDVLGLEIHDLLNRRLQTIVFKKKLSATTKQARQFIVHNHISINNRKINVPGYFVRKSEEDNISFANGSSLAKEDNPERVNIKNKKEKPIREYKPANRNKRGGRR